MIKFRICIDYRLLKQNPMNLDKFLDAIDEHKKLDRTDVFMDLMLIIILETFTKARILLNGLDQQKIEVFLADRETVRFREIYNLFEKAGKTSELQAITNDVRGSVVNEYVKYHFNSLDSKTKANILTKFSELEQF
jgi:hypothetical protein